jgi:predicted thioesterase
MDPANIHAQSPTMTGPTLEYGDDVIETSRPTIGIEVMVQHLAPIPVVLILAIENNLFKCPIV